MNKHYLLIVFLFSSVALFAQENGKVAGAVERAVLQSNVVSRSAQEFDEFDEGLLIRAEERLQMDRDRNGGYPKHDLNYYYRQILSEMEINSLSDEREIDPAVVYEAESRLQHERDSHVDEYGHEDGRAVHDLNYYIRQVLSERESNSSQDEKNLKKESSRYQLGDREIDPAIVYEAETRLQYERDSHVDEYGHEDGRAVHDLNYYIRQVLSERESNSSQDEKNLKKESTIELDPAIIHEAERRLQHERDSHVDEYGHEDGRAEHDLNYYIKQVVKDLEATPESTPAPVVK